jgi:hypothetical protein
MAVVTVTATGLGSAITPDNFTISIINYLGTSTSYATGVSRASLISGYNVTVNPGDVTVRATSTGTCSSSADVDVSSSALQTYRPGIIDPSTFGGSPDSLATNDGGIEYIIGEFDIYSFMSVNDFSLTHVSTEGSSGLPESGGPFVPPTLEVMAHPTLDTIALLVGYTRNSYSYDESTNTSIYKVTYLPNGLSRNVNYYWVAGL